MDNIHLILHNLEITYGDSEFRVDDFSLSVKRGEFVVILGESGSGKTTILNSIAGFLRPTKGDLLLDGKSIIHLPPGKREIGMVFQGAALFPKMTVYKNLQFGLNARKVPKNQQEQMIKWALQKVKLQDKEHAKPADLSSGQKQRVGLARLLLRGAKIWLLDEPLSNLDPPLKYELRDEIKKIQRENEVTTIYVTHSQSEALALADRIALIRNGNLIQYDSPENIYDQPLTTYVAEFVGDPGMNVFTASVSDSHGKRQLNIPELDVSFDLPNSFTGPEIGSVGFRPEDVMNLNPQAEINRIAAEVVSKEIRGKNILLKVRVTDREFYIEGSRELLEHQNRIDISLQSSMFMFFDHSNSRIKVAT